MDSDNAVDPHDCCNYQRYIFFFSCRFIGNHRHLRKLAFHLRKTIKYTCCDNAGSTLTPVLSSQQHSPLNHPLLLSCAYWNVCFLFYCYEGKHFKLRIPPRIPVDPRISPKLWHNQLPSQPRYHCFPPTSVVILPGPVSLCLELGCDVYLNVSVALNLFNPETPDVRWCK